MEQDNEIYNTILKEFQLSGSASNKMQEAVESLIIYRMNICKLLKIPRFNIQVLAASKEAFLKDVSIHKSNIECYEKKQIEVKDKIKVNKQEIKMIKLHINRLEDKLMEEQQESKKLKENLRIFLSRERLKFIKSVLFRKYRVVFLKYSNEIDIKNKILECNRRKEEIRQEMQSFSNRLDRYNRKIIINKIALAEMRKSIINAQKHIDFLIIKVQSLDDYNDIEKKFRLDAQQCKEPQLVFAKTNYNYESKNL